MHTPSHRMKASLSTQLRHSTKSRWILVGTFLLLLSPTIVYAQPAAGIPKTGAPAPQSVDARITQLETAVKSLSATATKLSSDQTTFSADVKEVKDKLVDAG